MHHKQYVFASESQFESLEDAINNVPEIICDEAYDQGCDSVTSGWAIDLKTGLMQWVNGFGPWEELSNIDQVIKYFDDWVNKETKQNIDKAKKGIAKSLEQRNKWDITYYASMLSQAWEAEDLGKKPITLDRLINDNDFELNATQWSEPGWTKLRNEEGDIPGPTRYIVMVDFHT